MRTPSVIVSVEMRVIDWRTFLEIKKTDAATLQ
jgi:hypothetical protein